LLVEDIPWEVYMHPENSVIGSSPETLKGTSLNCHTHNNKPSFTESLGNNCGELSGGFALWSH
jgi:hypothetical protein